MKYVVSSVLYLVILLCLSVFVFDRTNLYYEIPWLDIPMHVMGGFGVAALLLSVASYLNKRISSIFLLSVYVGVAIGWEGYEVIKDMVQGSPLNSWTDTISDIINGGVGALGAYYLLKK